MNLFLFASESAEFAEIMPINFVVWAICIGVNLGYIATFISKNATGIIVRKLLASATSEDAAKTLAELGYQRVSFSHKVMLKDGSSLRNVVYVVGGQIPLAENSEGAMVPDWESARFYIPESQNKRATVMYGKKQNWIFLPIFTILSIALSALMAWLMPMLMGAIL